VSVAQARMGVLRGRLQLASRPLADGPIPVTPDVPLSANGSRQVHSFIVRSTASRPTALGGVLPLRGAATGGWR
jgi:hypothetical protein